MPSISVNTADIGRNFGSILGKYVSRVEASSKQVLRQEIGTLRDVILELWPVDTFASRGGWQGPIPIEGLSGEIGFLLKNEFDYAAVIEFGLYPGVGPKTALQPTTILPGEQTIHRGIFPTQKPHAPVRRALSRRFLALNRALANALEP